MFLCYILYSILILNLIFPVRSITFKESNRYNPFYCLKILDSLFVNDDEKACLKVEKLMECAIQYFPSKTEYTMIKGLENLKEELCSEKYEKDAENVNKCFSKQRYHLYSCMHKYSTVQPTDSGTLSTEELECRRSARLSSQCSVLNVPCPARADYIAREVLTAYFDSFFTACFDVAWVPRWTVKVTTKDYTPLVTCMDTNSEKITQCLAKWIAHDASGKIDSKVNYCSAYDLFVNCVKDVIHQSCNSSFIGMLTDIAGKIKPYVVHNCNGENEIMGPVDDMLAAEGFTMNTPTDLSDQDVEKNTATTDQNTRTVSTSEATKSLLDSSITVTSQNSDKYNFKALTELFSTKLGEKKFKNTVTTPINASTTNVTDPIVIHKNVFITVTYRAKSNSQSPYVCYILLGILILIQFLYLQL